MAKPSLALIPSGYANNKVFSVLPSNGDGDFNFTRGSAATRLNSEGLIETVSNDLPRLNYPLIDGKVVGCPHHILEPQRTNLVLESNNFNNYFTKINLASVQSNQVISPDGTLNADKIIRGNADLSLRRNGQVTVGTEYTFSIYAKKGTASSVLLDIGDEGAVTFNLTDYWQRFSVTANPSTYGHIDIEIPNANQGDYIYVFGAMVESGSHPTSYIPTNGSATTRLAETCNGAGTSDTFSDSSGVLMVEMSALADDLSNRILSISNGAYNNSTRIGYNTTSNSIEYRVVSSSSIQAQLIYALPDIKTNNKISVKYKSNDFALWVNGFKVGTDLSGLTSIGLDRLNFDDGGGAADFYGNTKQIQYFDTALTDSELETLTSWVSFQEMAEGQLYTIE